MKEFKTIRNAWALPKSSTIVEYQLLCTRASSPFNRKEVYRMFKVLDEYVVIKDERIYYIEPFDEDELYFEMEDGAEFVRYDKLDEVVLDLMDEVETALSLLIGETNK